MKLEDLPLEIENIILDYKTQMENIKKKYFITYENRTGIYSDYEVYINNIVKSFSQKQLENYIKKYELCRKKYHEINDKYDKIGIIILDEDNNIIYDDSKIHINRGFYYISESDSKSDSESNSESEIK